VATPSSNNLAADADLAELAARAEAFYANELKSALEPEHNNAYVAIHVDTRDYAVAPTFREAKRIMLGRHPIDGKLVVIKIGPEPDNDNFTERYLQSERKVAQPK
jgi:hypothetical protein